MRNNNIMIPQNSNCLASNYIMVWQITGISCYKPRWKPMMHKQVAIVMACRGRNWSGARLNNQPQLDGHISPKKDGAHQLHQRIHTHSRLMKDSPLYYNTLNIVYASLEMTTLCIILFYQSLLD